MAATYDDLCRRVTAAKAEVDRLEQAAWAVTVEEEERRAVIIGAQRLAEGRLADAQLALRRHIDEAAA